MKSLPWVVLSLVLAATASGCAHYSTARLPEAERTINAPIDVVWEKTLEILPMERMTLSEVRKADYFVSAKKHMTFWSLGDDVSIRLIPKGEAQTLVYFDAGTRWGWGDMGHEGRMVRSVFDRIKRAAEGLPRPEQQQALPSKAAVPRWKQ